MSDPATLLALAERCEQATGPDKELDFTIDGFMLKHGPETDRIRNPRYVLPYTASLDAAVTLVPEGWRWKAILRDSIRGENTGEGYVHNGRLHMTGDYRGFSNFAATPALALCAAALRARAAMAQSSSIA